MLLQPVILGSQNAMSAVDGATIELRIRISRPDEGRGRCKGSRAWDPRKDFSQCMRQPIILSTSSAISPQQERTEPSAHRPCIHGTKSSLSPTGQEICCVWVLGSTSVMEANHECSCTTDRVDAKRC